MMEEKDKYEKITTVLRNSKPALQHPELFEEKVMEKIRGRKIARPVTILDYLFSWVYVPWVRNGLVSAAFLFIAFFAIQQTIILRRVNELEKQALYSGTFIRHPSGDDPDYVLYKTYTDKIQSSTGKISDHEMKLIFESFSEIQTRYKSIVSLIDKNPDLKNYIVKKLSENDRKKFKI